MFYEKNRQRFIEAFGGALVVVAGYDLMQQSGDMAAPFLQEANFWWLTGIEEPGWKLIIDGARGKTALVKPTLTDAQQIFDGGLSEDAALKLSGANSILPAKDLERELTQLARKHPLVYTVGNRQKGMQVNAAQNQLTTKLERIFARVETCNKQLAGLRAIKQSHELEQIKKAIKVTIEAYDEVRKNWQQYKYEYEVEAEFSYAFNRQGYQHAYAPIVAAGGNACTLHYDKNAAVIKKRDCTVIDIGARVGGYAADITRTYCQNPSKRQQQVHTALQQAHQNIIDLLKPNLLVADYIASVDKIMKNAIISLGLMGDASDEAGYRKYFPHSVSHGLGVDVHDSLGGPRYFRPGMVLTVEPGIYIPEESIGMRIEDDILITSNSHLNLSANLSTDL